jgi:hypothetical protein
MAVVRVYKLICTEFIMPSLTTVVSVVEPDRTVKAPPGVEVGSMVLVAPVPSMSELFHDTARRARFAATHRAIREAMRATMEPAPLSDIDIVSLVHRARQASRDD